ncbi:BBE domain-containing protein [Microbispora rosea]|uniref:BBE domain-containing protein n=1 Tax=Microbispora rosea TaxID=58117 RepID=UPI00341C1D1B
MTAPATSFASEPCGPAAGIAVPLLSPGDTAANSFSGSTLARLREIKRARDPHNVFRANYPVLR